MGARFQSWSHAWLIALDQLAYVTLGFWACVVRGHRTPSPYETISSKVGRMSAMGRPWARIAEPMIDRLFMCVGSPPGHCQRSVVRADWIASTLP